MTQSTRPQWKLGRRSILAAVTVSFTGCLNFTESSDESQPAAETPTEESRDETTVDDESEYPAGLSDTGATEQLVMTHVEELIRKQYRREVHDGSSEYEFVVDGDSIRKYRRRNNFNESIDAYTTDQFETSIVRVEPDAGPVFYTQEARLRNVEASTPTLRRHIMIGDYQPVERQPADDPDDVRITLRADGLSSDIEDLRPPDDYAGEATVSGSGIILDITGREIYDDRTKSFTSTITDLGQAAPEPPSWEQEVQDGIPEFSVEVNDDVLTLQQTDGPEIRDRFILQFLDANGSAFQEQSVTGGPGNDATHIAVVTGESHTNVYETPPDSVDPLPDFSGIGIRAHGVRVKTYDRTSVTQE